MTVSLDFEPYRDAAVRAAIDAFTHPLPGHSIAADARLTPGVGLFILRNQPDSNSPVLRTASRVGSTFFVLYDRVARIDVVDGVHGPQPSYDDSRNAEETLDALADAEEFAAGRDALIRIVHSPSLLFEAAWLHMSDGDDELVVIRSPSGEKGRRTVESLQQELDRFRRER